MVWVKNRYHLTKKPDQLKPPKCVGATKYVGASKEMFNEILGAITKAKNDRLTTNLDGREITKINRSKFKKEYNSIADDVAAIIQKPMLTRIQEKMV